MSSFLLKYYRAFYLLLPVLLGLALGNLAATAVGVYLTPPVLTGSEQVAPRTPIDRPTALADFQPILDRNIFDSTAAQSADLSAAAAAAGAAGPAVRSDLTLFGTITRGGDSLAVIRIGDKVKTYRLGDEIPGGGTIAAIERHSVRIRTGNDAEQILQLYDTANGGNDAAPTPAAAAPTTGAAPTGQGIRAAGENRWVIPQAVAEQARGNIGELLKQARLEPNMVNGKTEGFVVRMIQPRSVLANLGLQRGDVVMQVNGVELDSPEKALQIFQQLREAKNLSIGLLRNGNRQTFEYEIN